LGQEHGQRWRKRNGKGLVGKRVVVITDTTDKVLRKH
jgi:hypothetical protein